MNKKKLSLWFLIPLLISIVLVLVLGVITPAQAAITDDDGVIGEDEVIDDDIFLNAENVVVDGTVNGVLLAVGNTITINGTINSDVIALGNIIKISETALIEGNLLIGGQSIEVNGEVTGSIAGGSTSMVLGEGTSVGHNLYYGGFSLETETGTTITKSLYAGVYQSILNGKVNQDVHIGAGAVELGGAIGRNANFDVGEPAAGPMGPVFMPPGMPAFPEPIDPGLRISENATIGGTLTYTSPIEQSSAIEVEPEKGIVYQTPVVVEREEEIPPEPGLGSFLASNFIRSMLKFFRNLVTLLILGGLALWLLPALFINTADKVCAKPLPSAGYGILTIILGYAVAFLVAIVILFVGLFLTLVSLGGLSRTIFGVGFSGLALVFTIFSMLVGYGSKLIIAYLAGDWVMRKLSPQSSTKKIWALVIGVVIYAFLRAIPFLGFLIGLIATIIGMGAMWLVYQDQHFLKTSPALAATEPGKEETTSQADAASE